MSGDTAAALVGFAQTAAICHAAAAAIAKF
jgi:hypothetical protein